MKTERRKDIDILKTIALLCIILAHVYPPDNLFQIRNFDVVMMIMISAYLGLNNYKNGNYFKYLLKRICRLVIPTWIFLIIFFLINYIFKINNFSFSQIVDSFKLNYGIGYVWIIRIYLIKNIYF